tara:strand:- start:6207 stop:6374 length:168 start_codon:yes stop_codon:yes gene_type:complete
LHCCLPQKLNFDLNAGRLKYVRKKCAHLNQDNSKTADYLFKNQKKKIKKKIRFFS